jgi:transcriptional regulator GlxA family with amidase domain
MDKLINYETPIRIGLMLIDGFALMSYSAVVEPLRAANLLAERGLYHIRHIAEYGARATSSNGATVNATAHVGEHVDFDYLFVIAGGDPAKFKDRRAFQWLRYLAKRGVILGGISGGPVVLAAAGVMEGRRMTVHWEHAGLLAEISPNLFIERTLYVVDSDRITCAGGIAPLDLMNALITEHYGAIFSQRVSDWFMHTDIRPSGGPQRAGITERHGTTSRPVVLAIEAMENHIVDPLSLTQLALLTGISARQLNRLFRHKLDQSTMEFYRDLRLEKARGLLIRSPLPINQIAQATGFSSPAHFSQCFGVRYGRSPISLR